MKLIISPAKKMNVSRDIQEPAGLPCFLDRARLLLSRIQGLSRQQAKELWKCSDALADLNYRRFQKMDLERGLSPALLSYEGIQYQYMAPQVLEQGQLDYLEDHLRILSGFYGILKPFDGVTPYRLEMQARFPDGLSGCEDGSLYGFWGKSLYEELTREDTVIINLASKEYSRAVQPYLSASDTWVDVTFASLVPDRQGVPQLKTRATQAKMARGEMVRYLSQIKAGSPEDLKGFDRLGYRFCEGRSEEGRVVFVKEG